MTDNPNCDLRGLNKVLIMIDTGSRVLLFLASCLDILHLLLYGTCAL